MQLTIIIPTLNERTGLPTIVAAALALRPQEILVVDGGSTDGTREWIQLQAGLRLIDSVRGRGPQLNAGARSALGDVLLFLHADCLPPPDTTAAIDSVLQNANSAGGCFSVRFAERRPWSLRLVAKVINWHSRAFRYATGDQAIFVRRAIFDSVDGFPDWPLFEDVEFVRRLNQKGHFVVLRSNITLSARRWLARGVWRTSFLMLALFAGYRVGIPASRLKAWYSDVR